MSVEESRLNQNNPFEEGQSKLGGLSKGAAAVMTLGVGAVLQHKVGLDPEFVVSPAVQTEITDGIIASNDLLRDASPPIAGAAIVAQAGYYVYSRFNRTAKARYELSKNDYSGAGEIGAGWRSKVLKSVGLVALAGLFIGTSTSIEEEISSGPIRTVTAAGDILGDGDERPVYVLETNDSHFMDDSRVSLGVVSVLEAASSVDEDVSVTPFERGLPHVYAGAGNSSDGIVLAVPSEVLALQDYDSNSAEKAIEQGKLPVVVDEDLGLEIGDSLSFLSGDQEDNELQVVGEIEDASGMNRAAVVTSLEGYTSIVEGEDNESSVYGIAVTGMDEAYIEQILEDAGLDSRTGVVTEDEFIDNNTDFWKSNGTAILLQQMLYIGSFAGAAIGAARRNKIQQNVKEIGTLLSMGMSKTTLTGIEALRAARNTGWSMIAAAAGMPAMAAGLNAAVQGLEVGTSIRSAATAYVVMLGSSVLPSVKAMSGFTKKASPARMMKG